MDQSTAKFIKEHQREQVRQKKRAIVEFVDAIKKRVHLGDTFNDLTETGAITDALRHIAKNEDFSIRSRRHFLQFWLEDSSSFRDEVRDYSLLMTALRKLLPPYAGGAVELFRGDSFGARCHRTYGSSWSDDIQTARSFAIDAYRESSIGGSVLLQCAAPPEAIICAPALLGDKTGEREFIVDRRYLKGVRVLERFLPTDPSVQTWAEFQRERRERWAR